MKSNTTITSIVIVLLLSAVLLGGIQATSAPVSTGNYPTLTNALKHILLNKENANRPISEDTRNTFSETSTYQDPNVVGSVSRTSGEAAVQRKSTYDGTAEHHSSTFYGRHGTEDDSRLGVVAAEAEAGVARLSGRGEVGDYEVKVASVGATGFAGVESGVGAKVKATVAEAGGSIGGVVGAKVGLSADTGIAIGPNVEMKVLGTGAKVGVSGVETCLFGSCLWIG